MLSLALVTPKQPMYIHIQDCTSLSSHLTTSGVCVYCVHARDMYLCVLVSSHLLFPCLYVPPPPHLSVLLVCMCFMCLYLGICVSVWLVFPLLSPTYFLCVYVLRVFVPNCVCLCLYTSSTSPLSFSPLPHSLPMSLHVNYTSPYIFPFSFPSAPSLCCPPHFAS
jgi:hypothetical protein